MSTGDTLRAELTGLLERNELAALAALGVKRHAVVRTLIGLTYDLTDVRSWRAIEALGLISAGLGPERARALIQRLLWMMREESGSNAWTAGQIIGEIVSRNPGPLKDIAPIVVSFHDEPVLRTGALWSLYRIGSVRPDLVAEFAPVAEEYLADPSPLVRALSVMALRALKAGADALGRARPDETPVRIYRGGAFQDTTVGKLAREGE